jgi:cytochrome c oxidase subunit 2
VNRATIRSPRSLKTIAAVLIGAFVVAACSADYPGFFPRAAVTQQGHETEGLYRFVFTIAALIFVLVEGLIVWSVLRYRRRDDALPKQTHGNRIAEATWTIVPAFIVVVLFFLSLQAQDKVQAKVAQPDVVVDVVGFQWQWTMGYGCPDSYADTPVVQPAKDCDFALTGAGNVGPDLHVPIAQTIRFRLHAADVIHSFYVPRFLYKLDVVPGRVNSFDVLVEQAGTYAGQCAELCGIGHKDMTFTLTAQDRAGYDSWYAAQKAGAQATPAPTQAGAISLNISATSAAGFDQTTLSAPADTPIALVFQNKDSSVQHNVTILAAGPNGENAAGQPNAAPGTSVTYQIAPLKAGTYNYLCTIHPTTMTGVLTVH